MRQQRSTGTAGGSRVPLTIPACTSHHLGGRLAHDVDNIERAVDGVGDGDGPLRSLSLHLLWSTHLVALGPRDAQGQHLLGPLSGPSRYVEAPQSSTKVKSNRKDHIRICLSRITQWQNDVNEVIK